MTVTLYNSNAEQNRLDKSGFLGTGTTVTGTMRGALDICSPTVEIAGDYTGYNYAQIGDNYYYILPDSTIVRNGITRLTMKRDPLFTFSAKIKALKAIAARTADMDKQSAYIVDDRLAFAAYKSVCTFNLGSFSDTIFLILVTAG